MRRRPRPISFKMQRWRQRPAPARGEQLTPQTLTVLAAIRPGEEEPLRDILRPIGDDIKGKRLEPGAVGPRIEFRDSRRIHFARFAILDDPDRGRERKRLLYSASYDGALDGHLAELIAITSDMDAIWGRVEGYTGTSAFQRSSAPTRRSQRPSISPSATRPSSASTRPSRFDVARRRWSTTHRAHRSGRCCGACPQPRRRGRLTARCNPAWRRSSGCSAHCPSCPTCSGRWRGAAWATCFTARCASSPAWTATGCSGG